MMSFQDPPQRKLFYIGINLDKRIRKNHPLRKIKELIDFDLMYNEVKDKYGYNGNESVPPPLILKLMLLLVLYNVRSERELMETLEERLDWLWFLDFDLDTDIPNHSVLSKARKRWGEEAFRGFYERIVWQCVEKGLGDGRKIFMDSGLIDSHQQNTETSVETVVADSKYGTISNYLSCFDRGIKAHVPDLKDVQSKSGLRGKIFSDYMFNYDSETDTYTCPRGKKLRRKSLHINRESVDYAALRSDCRVCELMPRCTKNKAGRTIKRHLRQEELDYMRALAGTAVSKNDIKTRQHLMERSFARAKRYGYDRARWRGLWRVRIQEYLIASIQNIQILLKYGTDPRIAVAVRRVREELNGELKSLFKSSSQYLLEFFQLLKSRFEGDLLLRTI